MIAAFSIWPIIKVFVLVFLSIYIVFAFVVVRQVQLMTSTLEVGFESQLRFLSLIHFLFAIAVLAFGIIIL